MASVQAVRKGDSNSHGARVEDVVVGHNTWDDFQNAGPRVYKHYSLPLVTGFQVDHPRLVPYHPPSDG